MAALRQAHIALVGDSVLDNKAYTGGGPCVTEHLELKVSSRHWSVTNCAVDGDVVQDVIESQIKTVPSSATFIVISAGGNDGLQLLSSLESEGLTCSSFCDKLANIERVFRDRYSQMLQSLGQLGLPMLVCTVYHPRFERHEWRTQIIASIGVACLNRVIRSEARKRRLPIIDLAWVFNRERDYANAIEPSSWGGDKISNNIIHVIDHHNFRSRGAAYWQRDYSAAETPGTNNGDRRDASRLARAAKNDGFRSR
mmetsp:Transcript_50378/g.100196  ORF Transcript_50378/g.100196 Transcript_50378/m.100196 type:complete len:254 (+) Transcript_50378:61-822(+)|eukprot:CAMPEP_0172667456 /NCGR_PEP_ID=MMETSP1074-20121228/8432_1 /TAXON_ID=2916 /ORGANISM="Ceratium fusus, Strain PA161109" /LENGTH=253 /DNA_ID=CAMNT_0013483961 /DNA_START=65 /DNA_END=826 /DNA_ORIENTATION=-